MPDTKSADALERYPNLRVEHHREQKSGGPGITENTAWSEVVCDRPGLRQIAHCAEAEDAEAIRAALEAQRGDGELVEAVIREVERATVKFPTWPSDPLHAVAVLGEEFGELTKAVLQSVYEPHKSTPNDVREEAVQTAAMALRFLASLDAYAYRHCEQHEQSAAALGQETPDAD